MGLRAGLLNEAVDIKRATIEKNEYGEDVETWNIIYHTRARVDQTSSQRTNENDEITMNLSKSFQLRIYVPLQAYDIIVCRNEEYRVTSLHKDRHNQLILATGDLINE